MGASHRRTAKQALALVDSFSQIPWSLRKTIYLLGEYLMRPIELVPWNFPLAQAGDLTGVWVPTADRDYLFYPYNVEDWDKDHVIGHELGHVLFKHTPRVEEWPASMREIYGSEVVGFRGRTGYEDAEEAQAEKFAHLIHNLAVRNGDVRRPDAGEGTEFERLRGALQ